MANARAKATNPVVVKKDENTPEPDTIIARAIIDISEAMKRIDAGPLKREAIVLLIRDRTGLTRRDINLVLDVMGALKQLYVKPDQPRPTQQKR